MRDHVDVLAGALQQFGRPEFSTRAVVSPSNQLDGGVALPHGAGEIDGRGDGLVLGEGPVAVRCLVAELPEFQVIGLPGAIPLAFLVVGVVGIGDPVGGLAGVAGAIALGRR